MGVHRLDRAQARRIAVRAQLLAAPRPTDLLTLVRELTLLQIDPTAAVAPSADLVAWSRLGSSYQPEHLRQALERDRTLFEHQGMVRPRAIWRSPGEPWRPGRNTSGRVSGCGANDAFRRDVLGLLGRCGPLLSRDIPDTSAVPWPSTGWTNNRNVTQMLEFLVLRGEVAVAGRRAGSDLGRRRAGLPGRHDRRAVERALRLRDERRLRAWASRGRRRRPARRAGGRRRRW